MPCLGERNRFYTYNIDFINESGEIAVSMKDFSVRKVTGEN